MFREVARINRRLSREETLELLRKQVRGVLSVIGDNRYPYGVPMNYWFSEEDGKIYFHSGKRGHKIDALRRCEKASFCIYDEGYRENGDWALIIKSVVVFGRVEFIEDYDRAIQVSRQLSYKFTKDEDYIESEIRRSGPGVLCFALVPEHIAGKWVKES